MLARAGSQKARGCMVTAAHCSLAALGLLYTPFYMQKSPKDFENPGELLIDVGRREDAKVLSFYNHPIVKRLCAD